MYTERQATLHGCLPSLLDDWDTKKLKLCAMRKNILYRADYRAAKAEQKSLVYDKTSPTNQPRKDPFHLSSLSPLSPQFQQQGQHSL
jgi:hypothetical protein